MRLVKFVCVATAHANGHSDAAFTIHAGTWAFCATGGNGHGHDWQPSDGLPLSEAMRLTARQLPAEPPSPELAQPAKAEGTRTARQR